MAANSLVVTVKAVGYDAEEDQYFVDWDSITDDESHAVYGGRTLFEANETLLVINSRIVNDAKEAQNTQHSAGLGLFDPVVLFGGRIGL